MQYNCMITSAIMLLYNTSINKKLITQYGQKLFVVAPLTETGPKEAMFTL